MLKKRILVLDGAMGTEIQRLRLSELDFRGNIFVDNRHNLLNNIDILSITKPDVVTSVHRAYLEAGADIITTNTFNSNAISQREFGTDELVELMNFSAARLARSIADDFTLKNPTKPRFVAGSIGPTAHSLTQGANKKNPFGFDDFVRAYTQQASALIKGGVDILLIETVYDLINAKAALKAVDSIRLVQNSSIPVVVSATISDNCTLPAGGSFDDFIDLVLQFSPFCIGLNCSSADKEFEPLFENLSQKTRLNICFYPNAGFPNTQGEYEQTPEKIASSIAKIVEKGLVNIVGGCCGTTPQHIKKIAEVVSSYNFNLLPYGDFI